VIEAMACGLPGGSVRLPARLSELVTDGTGRVVALRGDPWRLTGRTQRRSPKPPWKCWVIRIDTALRLAGGPEAAFSLDEMVDGYLQVLLSG